VRSLARLLYPTGARRTVQRGRLRGSTVVVGPGMGLSYIWNLDRAEWAWVRHVRAGDVVYDVGAHCGQSTLHLAAAVGAAGKVVAFEPYPDHYRRLAEHLALNRLAQVMPVRAAAASRDGAADYEFFADRPTEGRLRDPALVQDPAVPAISTVDTVRLDSWPQRGWPAATFLKIDVEGGARGVLEGAHELLRTQRPRFVVEMHDPDEQAAVAEVMRRHGYRAFSDAGREVTDLAAAWNPILYCVPA
jgi:FkbM family methyltransferase